MNEYHAVSDKQSCVSGDNVTRHVDKEDFRTIGMQRGCIAVVVEVEIIEGHLPEGQVVTAIDPRDKVDNG